MQSLLIDVNTGFIKHRLVVLSSLLSEENAAVIGSLDAMNALLPEKYRVIVDTEEYNERIRGNTVAYCQHCTTITTETDESGVKNDVESPTAIDYDIIHSYPLLLSSFDALLYGNKYREIWVCPKCGQDNDLATTVFNKTILKSPYYLSVIEQPPTKKLGVIDRATFQPAFERWARKFLAELEAAAGKFRAEYKGKDDHGQESIPIDTEGEGHD